MRKGEGEEQSPGSTHFGTVSELWRKIIYVREGRESSTIFLNCAVITTFNWLRAKTHDNFKNILKLRFIFYS